MRVSCAALSLALFAAPALAQERSDELVRLTQAALPKVVKVYGAGGVAGIPAYGSGVVIDRRGMILTAWSVSLRTDFLKVVDDEGRTAAVVLHRASPKLGLALLKTTEVVDWPVMEPGDSRAVKVGTRVLALGNAFNVAVGEEKPGVVEGTVAALAPLDARIGVVRGRLEGTVFLMDAPNNPGTQGGPVIDLEGKLIGINGAVVESRSTNTPLNFAIPLHNGEAFIAEGLGNWERSLAESEAELAEVELERRYELGLRVLRFHFNRPPPVYIDEVLPGTPAARAGLQPDDLIFQIDGRTVRTAEDYDEVVAGLLPQTRVAVSVKRGAEVVQLQLEVPEPAEVIDPSRSRAGRRLVGGGSDDESEAEPGDEPGDKPGDKPEEGSGEGD